MKFELNLLDFNTTLKWIISLRFIIVFTKKVVIEGYLSISFISYVMDHYIVSFTNKSFLRQTASKEHYYWMFQFYPETKGITFRNCSLDFAWTETFRSFILFLFGWKMSHNKIDNFLDLPIEEMNLRFHKINVKHGRFPFFLFQQLTLIQRKIDIHHFWLEDNRMKTTIHTNINNITILDSHMEFRYKKFRLMIKFDIEKTYGEDRSSTVDHYNIESGYLALNFSVISYTFCF